MFSISYETYVDRIYGGWLGKSIGGTIGARFEGYKGWIDIDPTDFFPDEIPPNDDLDLQILWLKVLEEKGSHLTSDDLAQAWQEHCWYPFNEYGTFRRNWALGIHPPYSGQFDNEFWETGMGCPIRSEIWSYVFPGAPDLAASYAEMDGTLDHTEQSVGAEKMLAAMGSMAFFISDVRRLIEMNLHYLPSDTTIQRQCERALYAYDRGLDLRSARQFLLSVEGHPEACDSRLNVPFTLLALLYGENDLERTLLYALNCGYDTDCTLATAGALIGQILGARQIPANLKGPIGDQLVMGISYNRQEMTLSALARDTARIGVLLVEKLSIPCVISAPLVLDPLPTIHAHPEISVEYEGLPCAMPGEQASVVVHVQGYLGDGTHHLDVIPPAGWQVMPERSTVSDMQRDITLCLYAQPNVVSLPQRNLFQVTLDDTIKHTFGIAGAGLWRFLGVYFDPIPPEDDPLAKTRRMNHHFVDRERAYVESDVDDRELYRHWSHVLGKPAIAPAYARLIELDNITQLQGEYAVYLSRTVLVPSEREAFIVIGNNDAYKFYLNDELIADVDEQIWWTPFNNSHRVRLCSGQNHFLVRLLKRGDLLKWSMGLRDIGRGSHNSADWFVDLADVNPLLEL